MGKRKETKRPNQEEALAKKEAILAALNKASKDLSSKEGIGAFDVASDDYYTFSRDEIKALVNGDMQKIEGWVSNMDRDHATRLLRWLIKEK